MRISVVVAVFNIEKYLSHCIQSLINQDYEDAEFILVDDGSNDESSLICDRACQSDSRFKVIHKENGGLSDARNAGIEAASGDYIMFIDGDDVIYKGTLKILSQVANQHEADVIQYNYSERQTADLENNISFSGLAHNVTQPNDFFRNLYLLGGPCASACTKLIKTSLISNLRFTKGKFHEDEFFTTDLLLKAKKICYISDFKPYQYIYRDGSIITSGFNSRKIYDICEMYNLRLKKVQEANLPFTFDITLSNFFSNLYILYNRARYHKDRSCSKHLLNELKKFSTKKIDNLSWEVKLMKICPSLIAPLFFHLRSLIKKNIV